VPSAPSGARSLDSAVDDGVAAFARRLEDAHCSQAVGHLLGKPALDRGCLGELGGVEQLGQAGREQAGGIVRAADADAFFDRDQPPAGHDPAMPAGCLPLAVDAKLVLVAEDHVELETRSAKQRGGADPAG
jgi:hypothetical protein